MDFIERMFGVAPDAGSGAYEAMLLVLPILGWAVLSLLRRRGARRELL